MKGWYDNKDKEKPFKNVVDLIFVAAMGPPDGGRTFITPRVPHYYLMFTDFKTSLFDIINLI
jgi:dynein heavy chain